MTTPTVLIAGSDPLWVTGLAAILHPTGVTCLCARDLTAVERALDAARVPVPSRPADGAAAAPETLDLIVSDWILQGSPMESFWSTARIRYRLREVPLIFMSERFPEDIVGRVRQLGEAYFLRTPLDPELFLELVDKLLWMPTRFARRLTADESIDSPIREPHMRREHRSSSSSVRRSAH